MLVRIVVVILITVGIVAGAFYGLTKRYQVPTRAMEPTLAKGDKVAVFRFWSTFSSPERKNVVVFAAPPSAKAQCGASGNQVERVIGLPGETVSEQTGQVLIDGKPLKESYVKAARRDSQTGLARTARAVLPHGGQPQGGVRLAHVRVGAEKRHRGPGRAYLLAAQPRRQRLTPALSGQFLVTVPWDCPSDMARRVMPRRSGTRVFMPRRGGKAPGEDTASRTRRPDMAPPALEGRASRDTSRL